MSLTVNAFKTLLSAATASVVAVITANSAQALTFSIGGTAPVPNTGVFSTQPGVTTIDFDSALPSGVSLSGGAIVSGFVSGQHRPPASDTSTTKFLTVGGSNPSAPTATFTFDTALNYFGLYWGSPDTYNTISFFKGATPVGSFTGNQFGPNTAGTYVNFFSTGAADLFDTVKFQSTQAAFEADNIAFRVIPTPALLPGLVGLGAAALKRNSKKQSGSEA